MFKIHAKTTVPKIDAKMVWGDIVIFKNRILFGLFMDIF